MGNNREIDFRHTFEHIRRSFCLNFAVAVKMATCDVNQHLCVYVIVGTYDLAPMYARYASRELALKALRNGVSVRANGDPMAGTTDSDTAGRAEPPDGCTCETAAMARCNRSLCMEYHRWLKVLLMAHGISLFGVCWLGPQATQISHMWIPQILNLEHFTHEKLQGTQSTQQILSIHTKITYGLDPTLNQWGIFKNIELTACRPDMILYTVALTLCPQLSEGVVYMLRSWWLGGSVWTIFEECKVMMN